jgi:protein involved in polysaccharide export with SLBB domain
MKHVLLSLCTVALLLQSAPVAAQSDIGTSPLQSLTGTERSGQSAAALLSREGAPVARTIDPELYYCGAGDVMSLVLTMPLNLEVLLQVTADGALVIPRLGAVHAAGKTLAQVKQDVFTAMRRKWQSAEGTLSLAQARPIIVSIMGEVKTPGLLTLTAATPVSIALRMADVSEQKPAPTSVLQTQGEAGNDPGYRARLSNRYFGTTDTETRAVRRIVVQHADGSTSRADIPLYEATRDGRHDPLLREGDVIVVPARDVSAPRIAVLGAVRRPGVFDYIEGDKLSDLLRMGFGVDESRMIVGGELTRDGMAPLTLNTTELRSASFADDILLRPGDRLIVHAERRRERNGSAVADGEVARPGTYPITPGKTTLRELIDMAGGFTQDAWPGLSELYRRQQGTDGLPLDLSREKEKNFEKSGLYSEDTLNWSVSSRMREGQVAVDFHRLFIRRDGSADVPLEDGDILLVPRNTGTVYVYGQVNNGGFVPWSEDKDFDWYVEQAGGFATSATKNRASVIKANTRAWVHADDAVIEPGDMIFVPAEPLVALAKTTDILAVAAAVVGGLAGVVGLVISLSR